MYLRSFFLFYIYLQLATQPTTLIWRNTSLRASTAVETSVVGDGYFVRCQVWVVVTAVVKQQAVIINRYVLCDGVGVLLAVDV